MLFGYASDRAEEPKATTGGVAEVVNPNTISRLLKNRSDIASDTFRRVQQIIVATGYPPNLNRNLYVLAKTYEQLSAEHLALHDYLEGGGNAVKNNLQQIKAEAR